MSSVKNLQPQQLHQFGQTLHNHYFCVPYYPSCASQLLSLPQRLTVPSLFPMDRTDMSFHALLPSPMRNTSR